MKIEEKKKLIVAFDNVTNLYCFKTHLGAYNSELWVNDQKVKENKESLYGVGGFIVTKIKPEIAHISTPKKVIDFYQEVDGINILTEHEYKIKKEELTKNAEYDSNDYCYNFNNLEEELQFKYFEKGWKAVYKTVWKNELLDIFIKQSPVSEYSEIVPMFGLDDILNCKDGMFQYTPTPVKWFNEKMQSLGLKLAGEYDKQEEGTYSLSSHSGIRFAKLNGCYCVNEEEAKFNQVRGTYEECVARRKKDIESINTTCLKAYNKYYVKELSKNAMRLTIEFIDDFGKRLNSVEPKSRYYDDYRFAVKQFTEFKQNILKSLQNEQIS